MPQVQLTIGTRPVTIDTDNPVASQTSLQAALTETLTAERTAAGTAKEVELKGRLDAGDAARNHVADEIIARYSVAEDVVLSARVADDAKKVTYRQHLLSLPVELLLSEHKQAMTLTAKPVTPQTEGGNVQPPANPAPTGQEKTLAQKYAPEAKTVVTFA